MLFCDVQSFNRHGHKIWNQIISQVSFDGSKSNTQNPTALIGQRFQKPSTIWFLGLTVVQLQQSLSMWPWHSLKIHLHVYWKEQRFPQWTICQAPKGHPHSDVECGAHRSSSFRFPCDTIIPWCAAHLAALTVAEWCAVVWVFKYEHRWTYVYLVTHLCSSWPHCDRARSTH